MITAAKIRMRLDTTGIAQSIENIIRAGTARSGLAFSFLIELLAMILNVHRLEVNIL